MSLALSVDRAIRFSRAERLALEAIALDGPPGREAFDAWIRCVDIDAMSPSMVRLVPALFLRHAQGDPSVPHGQRLKGIARFWYTRNALLMAAAASSIRALRAAGIEVALFKGLSLALCVHPRTVARPMMDIDILVRRRDFAEADAILMGAGWTYRHPLEQRMWADHSIDYVDADNRALDLHVRPLLEVREGLLETELFARGRPIEWQGCMVTVPCLEDEALIALVGAIRERLGARLDWISDMARILERAPALDWGAIWERACRYGVAHQLVESMLVAGDIRGLGMIRDALASLLGRSPGIEQQFVSAALEAGRTYGLPDSLVSTPEREHRTGPSAMRLVSEDGGPVTALHLRRRHMDLVPHLLRVSDMARWRSCAARVPRHGEGVCEVSPGLIGMREPRMADDAYQARIILRSTPPAQLLPRERARIELTLVNASPCPWPLTTSEKVQIGVSWHVERHGGAVVTWDMPRHYLRAPLVSACCIAYIDPGGSLDCVLEFVAPAEPGRYVIRLDVVHEHVCWFSVRGSPFPTWELHVQDPPEEPSVQRLTG